MIQMTIHTVRAGESVYSIARQYRVPMGRIITDNDLRDPSRLTPGETLVIRYVTKSHVVQPGDTLFGIAQEYDIPLIELYQRNPQLGGKPVLFVGQTIVLETDDIPQGALKINGYAYPNIDRDVLRRTLPYLTWLSVFSYGYGDDGTVLPTNNGGLPALARQYGVRPLLVLTTLGGDGTFSGDRAHLLLNSQAMQENLKQSLLETMERENYGGVDVDFEYIPPEDTAAYAAFVTELRNLFAQKGMDVLVALAPKTGADQKGLLYEAHDYTALGQAADDALVMTYEWGYRCSEPMAVSPDAAIRRVLNYAATAIEPSKILMGFPNYGYDWTMPCPEGECCGKSLGNVQATDRAIEKGAAIRYDTAAQAPYYDYWQGNTRHTVWFENGLSCRAKLAIAREYGLGGVSIWNIMRYFPQLYLVLASEFGIEKR